MKSIVKTMRWGGALLLTIALVIGLMPAIPATAWAVEGADADEATVLAGDDNRDGQGYTLGGVAEELPESPVMNDNIWTVTPENAQYTLDGAYGSINGKTIRFAASKNDEKYDDVLVLARPTKFSGSNTEYYTMSWTSETNWQILNESNYSDKESWSDIMTYARTLEDVTFVADDGVALPGFSLSSGHQYGTQGNPAYDHVRETTIDSTPGSYYAYCSLENVAFDGLTISGQIFLSDYSSDSVGFDGNTSIDGITIENCTFEGDKPQMANSSFAAIKMAADSQTFDNVTVSNCSIADYYQGIYIQGPNNIAVSNCSIDNTKHNAIALQSSTNNSVKGTVLLEENVIQNASDRAIRFGDASDVESVVIRNNIMIDSGDNTGELIKAESLPSGTSSITLDGNYWSGEEVETAVADGLPLPTIVGVTDGTFPMLAASEADFAVYCASGFAPRFVDGAYVIGVNASIFDGGDGTGNDPYLIADSDSLKSFRETVNSGHSYAGEFVALSADINLANEEWEPIGAGTPFRGTFDGRNHTVSGLKMTSADADKPFCNAFNSGYACYGFFGGVDGGTVKNLRFADFAIDKPGDITLNNNTVAVAVGAAVNGATLSNIVVGTSDGDDTVTGASRTAGVVGFVGANTNAGGAQSGVGDILIENCVNYADIASRWTTSSHGTAGGICATVNTYSVIEEDSSITFCNNTNYGGTTGFFSAGILASSFVGSANVASQTDVVIDGNANHGNISVNSAAESEKETPIAIGITAGPIHGDAASTATIRNNANYGNITAKSVTLRDAAAGIVGAVYRNTVFEGTNANSGSVTATATAGGVVSSNYGAEFKNLTNAGAVTVTGSTTYTTSTDGDNVSVDGPRAGGIAAVVGNSGKVSGSIDGATCANSGAVSATASTETPYVGNLVGYVGIATVKNVSEADSIGAVRITGNASYATTLENVQLTDLVAVAGHTQSFTYKLALTRGSTIGTIAVDGDVHTGMTLEVSGGAVDTLEFTNLTAHDGGSTALSVAATDGAQVGAVDTTASTNKINKLSIAAVGGESSIDQVRTTAPVVIGFSHATSSVNTDNCDFPNSGTIGAVVTSNTDSGNYSVADPSTLAGNEGAEQVLYLAFELNGTARGILGGTASDAGTVNFTGVSLSADGNLSENLTIADGKTLVIEKGVTLTLGENTLTNNGAILNHGTIEGTIEESSTGTVTDFFTVTFESEGATLREIEVAENSAVAEPVAPTRDGYTFGGWYLGSVRFDFTTPIKDDITLVARWNLDSPYVPPANPTYAVGVSVDEPERGSVSVDPERARAGQTVSVTVEPVEGSEVVSVSVADADGNPVEATANADGTWTFVMPEGGATVSVELACDGGELCPSHGFSDMNTNEWYHDAIDWAVESGVLHGIGGTDRMEPDGKITRAQMAQVLYNVEGAEAGDSALLSGYSDADANAWYAGALSWAVEEGIFSGWQDGSASYIDPEGALTREQAAAVLMRWTEANGGDVSGRADLSDYPDAESVSEWATESMRWAVSAGVLSGVSQPDGTLLLDGQGTATRAQTAQLMMRLLAEQA